MDSADVGGRLSGDDVARLSEQIAGLTEAGLPLSQGLRATAEELPPGRLRTSLTRIAGALDGGATLEEAVAAQGAALPDHLKGIVLIGARTGRMTDVLGRFVNFANVGADLRRRIVLSMAYPAVSLASALLVFAFVCGSLIGSFETIFKDFGIPLPKLTILIIIIGRALHLGWDVFLELLIGLVVFMVVVRLVLTPATRRSMLGGVPVFGAVWKNTSLAEFCHLLSLMLDCGIPLPEALRLTGEGVQDTSVTRSCTVMEREVAGGAPLSDAILRQSYFPRGLARVLNWAEGQQSLPRSLQMLGEMFEARARTQAGFAGSVLAVVTVFSILFFVGVIVVGLFLPLITLISKLSG